MHRLMDKWMDRRIMDGKKITNILILTYQVLNHDVLFHDCVCIPMPALSLQNTLSPFLVEVIQYSSTVWQHLLPRHTPLPCKDDANKLNDIIITVMKGTHSCLKCTPKTNYEWILSKS